MTIEEESLSEEDKLYNQGYNDALEGQCEIWLHGTEPSYKMGWRDGSGDKESGHRFEENESLKAWYKKLPSWQKGELPKTESKTYSKKMG